MKRFLVFRIVTYASAVGLLAVVALLLFIRLEEQVTATGIVEPEEAEEVRTLEAGIISVVCCEEGDVVRAGDLLIRLDDKRLSDELGRQRDVLARTEARLVVAEKKLAMTRKNALPEKLLATREEVRKAAMRVSGANKDMARAEKLHRSGLLSLDDFESARGKYLAAEEDLKVAKRKNEIVEAGLEDAIIDAAEAELGLIRQEIDASRRECVRLERSLDRLRIRSPVSGQVVSIAKGEGESVAPGLLLVVMATGTRTAIKALVSEADVLKVGRGQPAHIYSSVYSYRKYGIGEGTVEDVAMCAVERAGQRFYEVTVSVKESPFPLMLGSTATTKIIVSRKGILDIVLDRG